MGLSLFNLSALSLSCSYCFRLSVSNAAGSYPVYRFPRSSLPMKNRYHKRLEADFSQFFVWLEGIEGMEMDTIITWLSTVINRIH